MSGGQLVWRFEADQDAVGSVVGDAARTMEDGQAADVRSRIYREVTRPTVSCAL
jgi:hypothetical protein